MKSSSRDKAEGTVHKVKGKIKEMIARITNNPKLAAEGKTEKLSGKAQDKVSEVKQVFEK